MPLTKPFIGKWMKVSGPLGNVLSGREFISQVTFHMRVGVYYTVYMYFSRAQWDERLAVLPPKTKITVIGRLREFDRISVHLEDCKLVD